MLAPDLQILLTFISEMKKILIFGAILGFFAGAPAYAAVRDGTSSTISGRNASATQSRATATPRAATDSTRATTQTRAQKMVATRAGTLPISTPRTENTSRTRTAVIPGRTTARATTNTSRGAVTARAASTTNSAATSMSETRTGAAYNQCKSAYFQCMDQFCALKNDEYRRCSCSSRINDLIAVRKSLDDTNAKLSEFTENLDMVGMTAAQATAVHTASDGENALTRDVSASKALLTAIMNSIRGEDATVAGKWSDLNSINLSFDTANMFGLNDTAQVIAAYNGVELYNAVYPSCRTVVASDCNDASLQRAVTAYLMAIEQDCNTVQSALDGKKKELKTAIREGDAMLDLARIENRKKHNSSDMTTCINEVESAILSEQVCGANYHKCLDNGEFIDVTTGAPITGVVNFNDLGKLLKFDFAKDAVDQKLSQNPYNQKFLKNFETKTKKFAADALDKCTEIADAVWAEYLDKALLDIYYAQQSKVKTIQNGCFDLISACYAERETAITAAMTALINGNGETLLAPDKIVLTKQMCSDYIDSCNGMFGDDVIAQYIESQTKTDTLAACRAVAQQCFDDFGGTNYENFYTPNSGLFVSNIVDTDDDRKTALDWFTLYEYNEDGDRLPGYKSICAQRVADIASCADQIEEVFGGLDMVIARQSVQELGRYKYTKPEITGNIRAYGWAMRDTEGSIDLTKWEDGPNDSTHTYKFQNRRLRPTGVATEVYNQIIDSLITQCTNVEGRFIEAQFIDHTRYGANPNDNHNLCKLYPQIPNPANPSPTIETDYGFPMGQCSGTDLSGAICQPDNNSFEYQFSGEQQSHIYTLYREDVCPKNYTLNTDVNAWGVCSCWDNGGRRSINGLSGKCDTVINVRDEDTGTLETLFEQCSYDPENTSMNIMGGSLKVDPHTPRWSGHIIVQTQNPLYYWCKSTVNSDTNQVCPLNHQDDCRTYMNDHQEEFKNLPDGILN